ncbi:Transmembrane protein 18 [Tieghemiomyces parasiticus]|uniref:Transmembrane protein 18 n=1 Tax=Tieghemiomyces parasiticus TaxID=78921 RepID=A0A9W8ACL2_9FUNG|nr:Transmembrane protein 18 [Tieghemiomyces parasiticus]
MDSGSSSASAGAVAASFDWLGFLGNQYAVFRTDARAFYDAVHWDQPWLQALLALHVLLWVLALGPLRRSETGLSILFAGLCLLILAAPCLNLLGDRYWPHFSSTNYFQTNGHFITLVYSLPLMILLVVVLILLVAQVAQMLIRAKRQELRWQAKKRR